MLKRRILYLLFTMAFLTIFIWGSALGEGLLPKANDIYGEYMPSIEYALGRKPDESYSDEESQVLSWTIVTDEDYYQVGKYFGSSGCTIGNESFSEGILSIPVKRGSSEILFSYNLVDHSFSLTYPKGTRPENNASNSTVVETSIFPSFDSFLVEDMVGGLFVLPSAGNVIGRIPDQETIDNTGCVVQTFEKFSSEDYDMFSSYLQERGCTVENYSTNGSEITINLMMDGFGFSFIYDRENFIGKVLYPPKTKAEAIITPTPKQQTETMPTPKPFEKMYSETECYNIAISYLKKYLKNPSSLEVHSYTSSQNGRTYVFIIDYSAQNGFGGFSREKYYVIVDYDEGKVTSAYSF